MQRYPHISSSYAYILNLCCDISVAFELFNFFWNMLDSNLSKYVIIKPFKYKAIQWGSIDLYPLRFITCAPFFIFGKSFLEETPLNLGLSW